MGGVYLIFRAIGKFPIFFTLNFLNVRFFDPTIPNVTWQSDSLHKCTLNFIYLTNILIFC
jgi:hypothetical protein